MCSSTPLLSTWWRSYSNSASSTRYLATVCCSTSTSPALELRRRKCSGRGLDMLKFSVQDLQLHLSYFSCTVGIVGDVHEVINLWGVHLLHLTGYEHRRHTQQLQLVTTDSQTFSLEILVNDVHGHVEGLLEQLELGVHLDQPVNKYTPHFSIHTTTFKEVLLYHQPLLDCPEVGVHSRSIFCTKLWVFTILLINVTDPIRDCDLGHHFNSFVHCVTIFLQVHHLNLGHGLFRFNCSNWKTGT